VVSFERIHIGASLNIGLALNRAVSARSRPSASVSGGKGLNSGARIRQVGHLSAN